MTNFIRVVGMRPTRSRGFSLTFSGALRPLPLIVNKQSCFPHHAIRRRMYSVFPQGKTPFEGIRMNHSGDGLKKPNLPWGFSIYRCTYRDEEAWERMLQLIREDLQEFFENEDGEEPKPWADLLPFHQLVVNDYPNKFDGATSHEVRDHFNVWVDGQLPLVAASPEWLQQAFNDHKQKPVRWYERRPLHQAGPEYGFGARYNFALFVDDICLESLDHMSSPVVKIMSKQWGNLTPEERNYEIHPDWQDGTTEMDEEDVGWMYMHVSAYVELYDKLEYAHLGAWYNSYVRPPHMEDAIWDESSMPGFWRKKK